MKKIVTLLTIFVCCFFSVSSAQPVLESGDIPTTIGLEYITALRMPFNMTFNVGPPGESLQWDFAPFGMTYANQKLNTIISLDDPCLPEYPDSLPEIEEHFSQANTITMTDDCTRFMYQNVS